MIYCYVHIKTNSASIRPFRSYFPFSLYSFVFWESFPTIYTQLVNYFLNLHPSCVRVHPPRPSYLKNNVTPNLIFHICQYFVTLLKFRQLLLGHLAADVLLLYSNVRAPYDRTADDDTFMEYGAIQH